MPFSGTASRPQTYWASHYERFLKPVIEEGGTLVATRSTPVRGDVVRQIITNLITSDVVVADLTDHNPNVFWELGVRQSFRSGTVTIAEQGTRLPFDISSKATLFYNPADHVSLEDFRHDFKGALRDCIEKPDQVDSPVLESVTGRGSLYQVFRHQENQRRLNALLSELEGNLRLYESAIEITNKNKRIFARQTILTLRFRTDSIALLCTNRYLDLPDKLYKALEEYQYMVLALNAQLDNWATNSSGTDMWLREHNVTVRKFLANIVAIMSELKGRYERDPYAPFDADATNGAADS